MRRADRDEGSILVLGLGFIVICIVAVAIVVDASSMFLARRSLQARADAAALAGAQAVDLATYYADGPASRIALDPYRVRAAVERHVRRSTGQGRLTGVSVRGTEVIVSMTHRVRPPFSGWLTPSGAYDLGVEAGAVLSFRRE
jgi:threonine dehydrogenase-like Zn-dependent dehydrogenase